MTLVPSRWFLHLPLTCLWRAWRSALSAVQEVLPHQVLGLRLVSSTLWILSPQTWTSGAAAGTRLGDILTEGRQWLSFVWICPVWMNEWMSFLWRSKCVHANLHSVVFLIVVRILAISECTVTVHSFHSPAEGAVGRFRVLLTGSLIRRRLLKNKMTWESNPGQY